MLVVPLGHRGIQSVGPPVSVQSLAASNHRPPTRGGELTLRLELRVPERAAPESLPPGLRGC